MDGLTENTKQKLLTLLSGAYREIRNHNTYHKVNASPRLSNKTKHSFGNLHLLSFNWAASRKEKTRHGAHRDQLFPTGLSTGLQRVELLALSTVKFSVKTNSDLPDAGLTRARRTEPDCPALSKGLHLFRTERSTRKPEIMARGWLRGHAECHRPKARSIASDRTRGKSFL